MVMMFSFGCCSCTQSEPAKKEKDTFAHIISHRKLGKKAFKSYLDIIEPIFSIGVFIRRGQNQTASQS
jgi:hypothetical protein